MENHQSIAFALGGLAGNNAHGAGFLQAALKRENFTPIMISCTSGQIVWTYYYLKARKNPGQYNLLELIRRDIEKINPTQNRNIDMAIIALRGMEGVFRTAYPEFAQELYANSLESLRRIWTSGWGAFLLQEALGCFPGRVLVPLRPNEFYEDLRDTFKNEKEIGIVFNSYNPVDGVEYVYPNETARNMLSSQYDAGPTPPKRQRLNAYRDRTVYRDEITLDAVKNALWLYEYGFGRQQQAFGLDGAYYRQIMLSELTEAEKIYVARPLKYRWVGDPPTSWIGREDLKTEVWFDGSYAGERNQILLVNKLIDKGMLKEPYKKIRLCEMEVRVQRGYFDYIFEGFDIFGTAAEEAGERFQCSLETCDNCPLSK